MQQKSPPTRRDREGQLPAQPQAPAALRLHALVSTHLTLLISARCAGIVYSARCCRSSQIMLVLSSLPDAT